MKKQYLAKFEKINSNSTVYSIPKSIVFYKDSELGLIVREESPVNKISYVRCVPSLLKGYTEIGIKDAG